MKTVRGLEAAVSANVSSFWIPPDLLLEHLVSEHGLVTYLSLKKAARDFREALDTMKNHLIKEGRGRWVKKPIEQDTFDIEFPKRYLE